MVLSSYAHSIFVTGAKKGETLREFVDFEVFEQGLILSAKLGGEDHHNSDCLRHPTYSLLSSIPVKVIVIVSNRKPGVARPPEIIREVIGDYFVDAEYSFMGSYGDWLIHVSNIQYPWLGEVDIDDCELYPEIGTVVYDNYDYDAPSSR